MRILYICIIYYARGIFCEEQFLLRDSSRLLTVGISMKNFEKILAPIDSVSSTFFVWKTLNFSDKSN